MSYRRNLGHTIHNELEKSLWPCSVQRKAGTHKESTIPKAKHIKKLIKYYERTSPFNPFV